MCHVQLKTILILELVQNKVTQRKNEKFPLVINLYPPLAALYFTNKPLVLMSL